MYSPVVAPSLSGLNDDVDQQVDRRSSCPAAAVSQPRNGTVSAEITLTPERAKERGRERQSGQREEGCEAEN